MLNQALSGAGLAAVSVALAAQAGGCAQPAASRRCEQPTLRVQHTDDAFSVLPAERASALSCATTICFIRGPERVELSVEGSTTCLDVEVGQTLGLMRGNGKAALVTEDRGEK